MPENSWHRRVERALTSLGAEPTDDSRGATVPRYARRGRRREPSSRAAAAPTFSPPAMPDWARAPAPPEARPPRPLAPSAIAADDDAAPPPSAAMRAAAQRGTLIHQLLERLPRSSRRAAAARRWRWLEQRRASPMPRSAHEIADQVCAILSDRRFAALFGAGSLAEAPLAATLPDGRVIAGHGRPAAGRGRAASR